MDKFYWIHNNMCRAVVAYFMWFLGYNLYDQGICYRQEQDGSSSSQNVWSSIGTHLMSTTHLRIGWSYNFIASYAFLSFTQT